MAEYYPLLAKAVAGLPDSTPETRRAVYERARKALLGQLRKLDPPVPEADVEREGVALDEAIEKLEAEFAAKLNAAEEASPETKAEPAPSERPQAEAPKVEPPKPDILKTEPPKLDIKPPHIAHGSANGAPVLDEPASDDLDKEDIASIEAAVEKPIFPKVRREPQRPIAPQAPVPQPNRMGLWIVIGVIAVIVGGVAVAAWKLRDRPETLASLKTITAQQPGESSGKIVGRVEEAPSDKPAADTTKTPSELSAQQQAVQNAQQNVPVSYRAALLVQAPEEQSKVKTYFGTVVWRLDNVSNGPGETVGTALRATIDVPEDKIQANITIQKNVDASLPASHTMMIVFSMQPGSPTGSIKQIGVPQMRREDSANGEPLAGLPVPIMENSFLIGLAQGAAEAQNLEMLRSRQWIDIPIQFADNRIAKLTFEKGVGGQRAMEDALASWKGQ